MPEPTDSVREAILEAIFEGREHGQPAGGWAAAALAEAVDADAGE